MLSGRARSRRELPRTWFQYGFNPEVDNYDDDADEREHQYSTGLCAMNGALLEVVLKVLLSAMLRENNAFASQQLKECPTAPLH